MNEILVFGDSFSVASPHKWSWINLLSEKYKLNNHSKIGLSTSQVRDRLKSVVINDESHDNFLIICLTDKTREYMNIEDPAWNAKSTLLYKQSLSDIKEILKNQKNNFVIIWSFPSEYGKVKGWLSNNFIYVDKNTYEYFISFNNEIKPALIYYSRQECSHITNEDRLAKFFVQDIRPNHIANPDVHKRIAETVVKFINKEISGSVNLEV